MEVLLKKPTKARTNEVASNARKTPAQTRIATPRQFEPDQLFRCESEHMLLVLRRDIVERVEIPD
jgi:hypothetical protein